MSSHVADFNTQYKVITAKLLRQGCRYHKLRKTFSKLYICHYDLVSKFNVSLKSLHKQCLSEPEFYGDLVYKFRQEVSLKKISVGANMALLSYSKALILKIFAYAYQSTSAIFGGSNPNAHCGKKGTYVIQLINVFYFLRQYFNYSKTYV